MTGFSDEVSVSVFISLPFQRIDRQVHEFATQVKSDFIQSFKSHFQMVKNTHGRLKRSYWANLRNVASVVLYRYKRVLRRLRAVLAQLGVAVVAAP
jgi:hypothetical protein